ncbi:hypothetical protein AVEN_34398-1 [Araneus ventricosus]|uniref:DUF4371 domain-containing protein n=1 Tax=Araneus ventricosus TaxID=182803 RepID=A0A4Y2G823_ARAVE|nr:hypothetical protein AVEN_34398-1 [Araneus ventricosus]
MCLLKLLNEFEVFTLLFDESLNKATQSKQMDIHVRYWRDGDQEVKTRYLTSIFLGHSEVDKILAAFYSAVQKLKLSKLLHVSTDRPFVNWKFYELLQNNLKNQHNFQILCIGSCGLHILNNSFKHGEKATNWNINSILSSLYSLFKDAPVRREDLMKLSSSEKFPLKFCCHRWLENVPCAESALEIWADICKYVSKVDSGALPKVTCKSYCIIAQAAKEKLITVKLNFFYSVAKMLQPFLVLYQSDKPLVPFLAGDLFTLVKNMLEHFKVLKHNKCKSIDSISSLCSFDFTDVTNFNCIDNVSIGFIGDELLKKKRARKQASDKDVLDLKRDCQRFILRMLQTLMEKCPIAYQLLEMPFALTLTKWYFIA